MGFLDKYRKYDNLWIGIVIGIILPAVLFPIFIPIDHQTYAMIGKTYWQAVAMISPMFMSRCLFPSALLFFLLIWGNFNKTSKGILFSTIGITAVLILIQLTFKLAL